MAHHRDTNVPQKLDAAAIAEFEAQDEIVNINRRIADLTAKIASNPRGYEDLVSERARLYAKKAKRRRV